MRIHPFVAMDDFAFRKGSYYGTLFCDLITGQPIDLLPSRKQEDVKNWIQDHLTIKLMTRDGSNTYRKAIECTERPISQIMDRFHLLQNLHKCMLGALQRLLPKRWDKITQDTAVASVTIDDNQQELSKLNPKQQKKWELIQTIQKEYGEGIPIRILTWKYKLDRRTISKYIKTEFAPIQKKKPRPSMLNPFLEIIFEMVKNHATSRLIYEQIKRQLFKGGFDSVRVKVAAIRKELMKNSINEKPPEKSYGRQPTISLYWKLNQQLSEEERQDLNYALTKFPDTQEVYAFVQYFRECANNYDSLSIQRLIPSVRKDAIPEIRSFVNYLHKELQSIILSMHYTYSNGVIEGQINRLKTIKRMLYGSASFTLLKKRVLFHL
nr:transposase [uncultured Bacillus sp.]